MFFIFKLKTFYLTYLAEKKIFYQKLGLNRPQIKQSCLTQTLY